MPRPPTGQAGPYAAFGHALRRYRERAELTQEEVARRAGISTAYPGHLEHGRYLPSQEVLRALCRVLDADYNELAGLLGWQRPDEGEDAEVARFRSYPRPKRRAILEWLATWDLRRDDAEVREQEREQDGERDGGAARHEPR